LSDCRYEAEFMDQIEAIVASGPFRGAAPHLGAMHSHGLDRALVVSRRQPVGGPSPVRFAVGVGAACGAGGPLPAGMKDGAPTLVEAPSAQADRLPSFTTTRRDGLLDLRGLP